MRKRNWQQKWKETCRKWILGSITLGRADFNIWQVEFTNLCYSYWRETSYSFRDLYLLRHAAVFLQHGNKFASTYCSSSLIKIGMSCFKCLTDNYSEQSIKKVASLGPPLSLKNNKKNTKPQTHQQDKTTFFPPSSPLSFVSLITWSLVIKLSLVSGPLGQYLLVPCQTALQNNQSCSCTHLAEVLRHEECRALLLLWSFDDKSFYQKLTVFRVMNMQWLSLVLKRRSTGWHPPPLLAAAESSNELSCSFTCTGAAVMAPCSKGSCPVWEYCWLQKLIARNCSWFC